MVEEMTIKIINAVKEYPVLFDPSDPDYTKYYNKIPIWGKIAEDLRLENGKIAQGKWRNVRDSYLKFLKSQCNNDHNYRKYKKWQWEEQMSFLKPYLGSKVNKNESIVMKTEVSDALQNVELVYHIGKKDSKKCNNYGESEDTSHNVQQPAYHPTTQTMEYILEEVQPSATEYVPDSRTCVMTTFVKEVRNDDVIYGDDNNKTGHQVYPVEGGNSGGYNSNSQAEEDFHHQESGPYLTEGHQRQQGDSRTYQALPPPTTDAYGSALCSSSTMDATDYLFLSYSKTLKSFNKKRQIDVKRRIFQIISGAELEEENECELKKGKRGNGKK